jgi:hypothetical protein
MTTVANFGVFFSTGERGKLLAMELAEQDKTPRMKPRRYGMNESVKPGRALKTLLHQVVLNKQSVIYRELN